MAYLPSVDDMYVLYVHMNSASQTCFQNWPLKYYKRCP